MSSEPVQGAEKVRWSDRLKGCPERSHEAVRCGKRLGHKGSHRAIGRYGNAIDDTDYTVEWRHSDGSLEGQ